MITGLYAALLALLLCVLIVRVVRLRFKNQVSLGDKGHKDLQTAIRVHGNFVETVPIALILMLTLEMNGMALWGIKDIILHIMGLTLLTARTLHAYALSTPPGYGPFRKVSMGLTMLVYIIGAALCLWSFMAL